ncbi:ABC transporter permease [Galbitalea soli]|uniref:ABC transporter permease n=2 Tax=Galbitalea soli TaxID=1268042 RepID=A0A7C9TQK6_9MICO|nr:ABC transporter permease [Galbitalea soli]NEM90704.1 ABC transporter permease [Galbitalea soli]
MRQRVRSLAWYILLGVYVVLILLVTVILALTLGAYQSRGSNEAGNAIYSTVIYFVLLLGTLVAPALSGNSINGDRDAGTLATTQVTLVTTGQLVLGKFLAAWVTALAFLAASVPFLIYAGFAGHLTVGATAVSLLVLAVELGVVAAMGVGLSGLISRPLFSIVTTYLVVAALTVGTLIAFALGGLVVQSRQTTIYTGGTDTAQYDDQGRASACNPPVTQVQTIPRYDRVWGLLVANPYVLLADAVPTSYDTSGEQPVDLFGQLKFAERSAQIAPRVQQTIDECSAGYGASQASPTPRHVIDSTTPGWAVGMLAQLVLAAEALLGAWRRLRTPAGRLSKGTRIA